MFINPEKVKQKRFLTAEWRKLLMVNYEADPEDLLPYIPAKTELDLWNNKTYVSLVGFMFRNMKVKSLPIPFHRNFPEVNLRIYVRHKINDQWRQGIVFIKEFVSLPLIRFIANSFYHEHYSILPLKQEWQSANGKLRVEYSWKKNGAWYKMEAEAEDDSYWIEAGSKEEFISQRHWGYTAVHPGKTTEYHVRHPPWAMYRLKQSGIVCDFDAVYGTRFGFL